MEYVYAALLLHKLNKEVNEDNLKKVLQAAGVEVDETRAKSLVAALSEVNIDEALKSAVVAAAPAAAPAEAAPKEEAKKEEKKEEEEEKKEEEALAGLSSLFG